MKLLCCVVLCCFSVLNAVAEPIKVGLVLSGGGTKGGAHIGVIRALEENNVKISYVVGTSVGAIIGAMYATGLTADEIETAIAGIDWEDVLRDDPPRSSIPIQVKRGDFDYLVKAGIGFSDGQLKLPLGVSQGQKVTQLLRRLLQRGEGINGFDKLNIPFRAVATSLITGDAVVLGRGDLALSVRASMSLPGVFSPVDIRGQYLVDGGIAANLPIDVARQMGADRVIAVDITSPLLAKKDIDSVLGVTQQIINMMTRRNADEQIATLSSRDIIIRPDVKGIDTLDFANTLDAMQPGYAATTAISPQLRALAALTWQDGQPEQLDRQYEAKPLIIDFVETTDNSGLSEDAVLARLGIQLPTPFDRRLLDQEISRLYGSGLYQRIDYALIERDGQTGLSIDAEAKSWGPDYLQFGLQLEEDFSSDANFNVGVAYLKTSLNDLGAQWRSRLDLGVKQGINTEWFQPWSLDGRVFSRFQLGYERNNIRVYTDEGKAIADVRVQESGGLVSIGRQIGRASEVELAWQRQLGFADELVGDFDIPTSEFDIGEISLNYRRDTLNRTNRPSRGSLVRVTGIESSKYTGGDDYQQIHATAIKAFAVGNSQMALSTIIGSTINEDAPIQSNFTLGGLGRLSGHPIDRFFGQHIAFLRLNASKDFGRFKIPIFIGASVEVGNTWDEAFDKGPEAWLTAGSIYAGFSSPIGPVYLAAGFAEDGQSTVYLNLGNPFSARPYRPFD